MARRAVAGGPSLDDRPHSTQPSKRRGWGGFGSSAFAFVFSLGIVNLFADVTYEGGGSVNGPFLGTLGAGAAAIGIIAGVGEFLGYALRLGAGYVADKTGRAWLLTFIGYAINLAAVPALALAPSWEVAALFVVAERVGRAIRKPTVEAMLSYTTGELGRGWVYALNTALDEVGATLGPLVVALVLFLGSGFRVAYAWLGVSAVLALVALTVARFFFPKPEKLEREQTATTTHGFGASYWLTMTAGAFLAAGLVSFELISFHLAQSHVVPQPFIPVFLAIATAVGVVASLVFGKLFDKKGVAVIVVAVLVSSTFSPFVFFGGFFLVLAGLVLWGIGYATQDTLLKALIAGMLPEGKRNVGFGLFYAGYGVGWLVGSSATGLLYGWSPLAVVIFSVAAQLSSLPFFLWARRVDRSSSHRQRDGDEER